MDDTNNNIQVQGRMMGGLGNSVIRYFGIFHDLDLGSNPCFLNPEKILEGEDICVRPTHGSRFSRWSIIREFVHWKTQPSS